MAFKLKNLYIRQIALVDKGANPEAFIVLAKRDDTFTTGGSVVPVNLGKDFGPVAATVGAPDPSAAAYVGQQCPHCGAPLFRAFDDLVMCNDAACGRAYRMNGNGRLEPTAKSVDAGTWQAIRKFGEARRAFRQALDISKDNDMDFTAILKSRDPTADEVNREVGRWMEILLVRDPSLTIEKARAMAHDRPARISLPAGPGNPTLGTMHRAATEQDVTTEARILKQEANSAMAAAWSGLEELAAEMRRREPKLTPEGAMTKAMGLPQGAKLYNEYAKAQAALRKDR